MNDTFALSLSLFLDCSGQEPLGGVTRSRRLSLSLSVFLTPTSLFVLRAMAALSFAVGASEPQDKGVVRRL